MKPVFLIIDLLSYSLRPRIFKHELTRMKSKIGY